MGMSGKVNIKAAIAPFRQRQYLETPPWSPSYTLGRSVEFYEAFLDEHPSRVIHLARDTPPPVVVASDAQAEPGCYPGGGSLLADPHTGARRGGWYEFTDA